MACFGVLHVGKDNLHQQPLPSPPSPVPLTPSWGSRHSGVSRLDWLWPLPTHPDDALMPLGDSQHLYPTPLPNLLPVPSTKTPSHPQHGCGGGH